MQGYIKRCCVFLILVYTVAGQTVEVKGSVLERTTKVPISGARVRVSGSYGDHKAHEQYTESDAAGRFSVSVPSPGTFSFSASAVGYSIEAIHRQVRLELKSDATSPSIVLTIERSGSIEGRVLDLDNGAPVPNLSVTALRLTFQRGLRQSWFEGSPVNTDARGKFRINSLPPGEYVLEIDPSPWRPQTGRLSSKTHSDELYSRSLWPGDSLQAAAPVLLSAGAELMLGDIKIAKGRPSKLKVSIGGGSCSPGLSVAVELNQTVGSSRFSRGEFIAPCSKTIEVAGLAPGNYELVASANWQEQAEREYAAAAFEMLRVDHSMELTLKPAFSVDGSVELVGVKPDEGHKQSFPSGKIRLFPRGMLVNTFMSTVPGMPGAEIKPDGKFSALLHDPPGALVEVSLQGFPTGWFVKGLEYNLTPFAGKRFKFEPSASTHRLRVLLSNAPATIRGLVQDESGKFVSGAQILVVRWPCETTSGYPVDLIEVKSTADGSFSIENLLSGSYRAIAIQPEFRESLEQPGMLYSILQSVDEIVAKEGNVTNLQLRLLKR